MENSRLSNIIDSLEEKVDELETMNEHQAQELQQQEAMAQDYCD